jgi:hypothetical protein
MNFSSLGVSMGRAFDTDDCLLFSKALDCAWEIFLKTKRLTSQNYDIAKGALSYAILEAAAEGERRPRRLAIAAVTRMAKYEAQLQAGRSLSWGRVTS